MLHIQQWNYVPYTGHRNRLKFDDYVSDWFELNNGIVQGDLLSMILYLFYNADMLDIAHGRHELCLGYVDDMALIASADTFKNAHRMLGNMMSRPGGGLQWAVAHNSKFETSKSILIDFSRTKGVRCPDMSLQGSSSSQAPPINSWECSWIKSFVGSDRLTMC